MGKRFPILMYLSMRRRYGPLGVPESVPWELVAPHQERALANHRQTLDRLAERGGLSPSELLALLKNEPLNWRADNDEIGVVRELARLGVEIGVAREAT